MQRPRETKESLALWGVRMKCIEQAVVGIKMN